MCAEGDDHIDCSCGERVVIKHYVVKIFEVLEDFERDEYLEDHPQIKGVQ